MSVRGAHPASSDSRRPCDEKDSAAIVLGRRRQVRHVTNAARSIPCGDPMDGRSVIIRYAAERTHPEKGHGRETKSGGHCVRQIDYAQVGDPPVDTGLENLMGVDQRAVDGLRAAIEGG